MFPNVDEKIKKSENLIANIESTSMPVLSITPDGVNARVNAYISLISKNDG